MRYTVAEAAAEDLIDILAHGAEAYGETIACAYHNGLHETFELLGSFPELARLRTALAPPARIHPYGAHLIVYEALPDGGVRILRVRHASEDWINA
ncbi:hypothetical protein CKO28_21405 [Rhodovibrio sodomensis]|uniref:Toxin n=1 Tax=Rhodovibrio sodomensis TaxID=1088 RepID=A0ABS1DKQ8_9PROT|nr:hypothetical protein [Rhodovibrio sodomensis]